MTKSDPFSKASSGILTCSQFHQGTLSHPSLATGPKTTSDSQTPNTQGEVTHMCLSALPSLEKAGVLLFVWTQHDVPH